MMEELRKEELLSKRVSGFDGGPATPPGAADRTGMAYLKRSTHCKNRARGISSSLAWDDLTGMRLETGRVVEARAKEVTYFREKRVYDNTHSQHAMINMWNIIETLRIDINMGDDEHPVCRSRLVGK